MHHLQCSCTPLHTAGLAAGSGVWARLPPCMGFIGHCFWNRYIQWDCKSTRTRDGAKADPGARGLRMRDGIVQSGWLWRAFEPSLRTCLFPYSTKSILTVYLQTQPPPATLCAHRFTIAL